jgi:hypothetical protein
MLTKILGKNELGDFLPLPYYCRSLVLTVPIDTSGDTSFAQESDVEGPSVWWVLLVIDKLNLGYYNLCRVPTHNRDYTKQIHFQSTGMLQEISNSPTKLLNI